MKILSITTSSQICGVAILEDSVCIKEINLDNGLTHSETLMPLIKQILNETNLKLNDIDLFSVDIGPGSFTGIRIGISTIKAFIDSLQKPAIGINSLESLSYNIKHNAIICSLIDAKKDNVYVEILENIDGKYIVRRNPSFENIDTFLLELKNISPNYDLHFVGDGALKHKTTILNTFPNSSFSNTNSISALNVGMAAFVHFQNKEISNIEPLYLKKSAAEQMLEEQLNEAK